MAAPKITKKRTQQIINLKEEFGVDLRRNTALKQALGQAIIDKMLKRTSDGDGIIFTKDGKGRRVKLKSPYSDKYAESDEFKAFGKKKNKVNMELTGDMLASIDILRSRGNELVIGIDDPEEVEKSFNHNTGDTVPKRPFFGVSKKELREIKKEFNGDIKKAITARSEGDRDAFQEALLGLISRIGDRDGES